MKNFLVAGLGNPGEKYQKTRHNIGFRIVEEFLKNNSMSLADDWKFNKKLNTEIATIKDAEKIHLIKPMSFMNLSGIPISNTKKYFDIDLANIIVVHDDIDLPFGQIRLSKNSGAGGHNGIKSTIEYLRSKDFARLRVGISTKLSREKIPTEKFVLANFSTKEEKELTSIITSSCECLESFIKEGLEKTMNKFN